MSRPACSLVRSAVVCGSLLLMAIESSQSRAQAPSQPQPATKPMDGKAHEATPQSTSLTLTIAGKATVLTVLDLQAMPQKAISVKNEHTRVDESYSGVLLGDLLAKYGFPVDKATHRAMLRSYIVATGMDQYWVLYSATEIEGSEHNGDVLIALTRDGKLLGADGLIKLVASEDKRPERWVRNLTAIALKSAE